MDAKDLGTEIALSEHSNHANTNNYEQSSLSYQIEGKNKSYHDAASNSLPKVDIQTTRPCAVIGPDRILPQPVAANNSYMKQAHAEPWQYPRPPEYPHKFSEFQNLSRNISPRQTFQENMQRIMVPPRSMKTLEDNNLINEKSDPIPKNVTKINMPIEGKYCDVPYINPLTNEQKNLRNPVSNVNPTLLRGAWPPGGVAVRPSRPYAAPDIYQYPPDYTNCTGSHTLPVNRPFQPGHDDSVHNMYPDPYRGGNIRYEPYPPVRDRNVRYEYINYSSPYPSSHFPTHKYDPQKLGSAPGVPPQGYPGYPQIPLKYLREPHGYQRSPNPQPNYNVPYHNTGSHPNYGSIPGNCLPNKLYGYPTESNYNSPLVSKPYDNNKQYVKYDNIQTRHYPPENMYLNELSRSHQMKPPLTMSNSMNMPMMQSYPFYRKDNIPVRHYDLSVQFKNIDPSYNTQISRIPSHFSPVDSHTSNENHMFAISPEDCGYASQSSTTSVRSTDSGVNMFHRYSHFNRASPIISRTESESNTPISKNKKSINVRQFLQMWNEGDDENNESHSNKDVTVQSNAIDSKQNSELYVLGLVNVPSDELSKYEHIQKVSKLPDNIKGYTNIDLLNQFEEAIESSKMNNYSIRTPNAIENSVHFNNELHIKGTDVPNRPLSPLDVESRISQSVIHKEVGCNFEIKPCSPKMLNVEIAAPLKLHEERSIEKVTNQLVVKSPNVLKDIEKNVSNCHVIKRQNRPSLSNDDNTNISSCKMTKKHLFTDVSIDINRENDKSSYSFQDLESNSGVCLASLPRLDNDIELSFPEVNQQFINANRVESDILNSTNSTKFANKNEINSPIHEAELPKLSKYRKNKSNRECSDQSHSILQATRTDSVIIKNPESSENITDENFIDTKNEVLDSTSLPINLAVHGSSEKKESKEVADSVVTSDCTINLCLNSVTQREYSNDLSKEMSISSPALPDTAKIEYNAPFKTTCFNEKDEEKLVPETNVKTLLLSELSPKKCSLDSSGVNYNEDGITDINKVTYSKKPTLLIENNEIEVNNDAYNSDSEKNYADQRARHEKLYKLLEERVNDLPENLLTPLSESTINDVSQDGFMSDNDIVPNAEFHDNVSYNNTDTENMDKSSDIIKSPIELECASKSKYHDFDEVNLKSQSEEVSKTERNVHLNSAISEQYLNIENNESLQLNANENETNTNHHASFIPFLPDEENNDMNSLKVYNHDDFTEISQLKNHVEDKKATSIYENPKNLDGFSEISQLTNHLEDKKANAIYDNFKIETKKLFFNDITDELEVKSKRTFDKHDNLINNIDKIEKQYHSEPKIKLNKNYDKTDSNIKKSNGIFRGNITANNRNNNVLTNSNEIKTIYFDDEIDKNNREFEEFSSQEVQNHASTESKKSIDKNDITSVHEFSIEKIKGAETVTEINKINMEIAIDKNPLMQIDQETDNTSIVSEKNKINLDLEKENVEDIKSMPEKVLPDDAANTNVSHLLSDTEVSRKKIDYSNVGEIKASSQNRLFSFRKELYSAQIQKLIYFEEGCIVTTSQNVSRNDSDISTFVKFTNELSSAAFNDADNLQSSDVFEKMKIDNNVEPSTVTIEEVKLDYVPQDNILEMKVVKDEKLYSDCKDKYIQNNYIADEEDNTQFKTEDDVSILGYLNTNQLSSNSFDEKCEEEKTQVIRDDCVFSSDSTNLGTNNTSNNNDVFNCVIPTEQDNNLSSQLFTHRPILKRALSEPALHSSDEFLCSDKTSLWPNKRKKVHQTVNVNTNSNESSGCYQLRRNSISSVYHEENISFCILIDNNCLITQEDYAEDAVCFADIQEEGVASVNENDFETDDAKYKTVQCVSPDNDNSKISEPYNEYVSPKDGLDENWVEDVACMETVVSDDVVDEDDEVLIEQYSSPPQCRDIFDHTSKLKNIYGDEMCIGNINLIKTLYSTPQMDMNKTLQEKESLILESTKQYDTDCLESILSDAYINEAISNNATCTESSVVSFDKSTNDSKNRHTFSKSFENSDIFDNEELNNRDKFLQENLDGLERELSINAQKSLTAAEEDTTNFCESTVSEASCLDQSIRRLKYKRSSSSPEVSSTTEEKKTGILLKITNYNGSRISQIDNVDFNVNDTKRIRCKLTERDGYSDCKNDLDYPRPLLTKAAQKYIPPTKETRHDLKIKLFLPPHSLMKLKQMKVCQEEPKTPFQKYSKSNRINFINTTSEIVKKSKPKFEDVLKSIDELQIKGHKDKYKKSKSSIPKVIIKKTENGSHYASTSNKDPFNPDMTGRKWQPWVFLEKNKLIDKMAAKGKTRAMYCHRKKCYILAERFQKYKSVGSTKFIISQPKLRGEKEACLPGPLKYTIKLKQSY